MTVPLRRLPISSASFSRRRLLRLGGGALLGAGIWPGRLSAEDADFGRPFHFLAVNDTHYLDDKSGPWLERVVTQMRGHCEPIEFCLLAGDIANDGEAKQLGPAKEIFAKLGKPVYPVIGNHDYFSAAERHTYTDAFPDRINYTFAHDAWQFIGLDSSEGLKYEKTAVQAETLKWLDERLPKLDRRRPLVVFTHFPLGEAVTYRPANADDVLARFKEFNLQAIFCGHFHGLTEKRHAAATITTNRCCAISRGNHDGSREKGYFLCTARDGRIERKFVEVKPA